MTTPIHPPKKTALIPIILTHPDGRSQTYWISLKRFMEEREKGTPIRRIPRKEYQSVLIPDKPAADYEIEFIENLVDFNVAGLEIKDNKFEVELIYEVRVKKNGKHVGTYPIKLGREEIAKAILKKILDKK